MVATVADRLTGGPGGPARANNARVSEREDLANFISMITRDETPFMSSIGKTKATAIYHEWQTDQLASPGDSRIAEGQNYLNPGVTATQTPEVPAAFNPVGPHRTRLGNYTQINGKTIAVSGTKRAVDQAGVADEYAYQLKKRGTEMRRDVEADLVNSFNVSAAARTAQTGAASRSFGGYQAFINLDQTCRAASGSSGITLRGLDPDSATGGGDGDTTIAVSSPTLGSLSLSDIDQVMQDIYEEGGKASKIMVSPKLRRDFSDLMVTDSGVRRNIDMDGKLRQSVDIYMSDFGDLMVVPNYIMGLNTGNSLTGVTNTADFSALIYDPMWFSIATLRPLQEVDVGQQGDSTVGMMVEECTLEVKNPLGCGAIYGLS